MKSIDLLFLTVDEITNEKNTQNKYTFIIWMSILLDDSQQTTFVLEM